MGRPKVAPVDYCCPYRKACPELIGRPALEVRFAVSECERLERRYGMLAYETNLTIRNLEAQLDEKQKRIDELQAQLVAGHRRQFKAARQAGHAIKAPERFRIKKRRPGAPKGHPPWSRRKPDHIDSTVNVAAPQVCPHCAKAGLSPSGGQHRQLQEDIVIEPRTKVTEYIHGSGLLPALPP